MVRNLNLQHDIPRRSGAAMEEQQTLMDEDIPLPFDFRKLTKYQLAVTLPPQQMLEGKALTHSYETATEFICPTCKRPFSGSVWLIVDAAGRPDLLERIRTGTLQTLSCPNCGSEMGDAAAPA
jgi:predicted RNA-binding Zn-ribbon protein involved in translation (DUF1610 family)